MGMNARDIPDLVNWYEGLLLTPQHFQQMTLRHEALLHYSASAIAPFYWGVVSDPVVDSTYLQTAKTLQISNLEAVMPDALVVSLPKARHPQLSLDLKDYISQAQEGPLTIYLTVAGREAHYTSEGDDARYYQLPGDPVLDESTGEEEAISRLAPSLRLRTKDKLAGRVGFPLLRVRMNNEVFELDHNFIAPTLTVTAQSPLGQLCAGIADKVRKKATLLSGQSSSPSSRADMRLDLETRSRIRSLVAGLPYLEALLMAEVSHPFQVYLALCSMLGHLSVFGSQLVPEVLPKYNHDDLRVTFEKIRIRIYEMIEEEGAASAYKVYPFHYRDDGIYQLRFVEDWIDKRLVLGIKGQTGMSEKDIIDWGNECLIGSRERLRTMMENRTLGARRKQIARADDLVPPRGAVLFSLKADPESIKPGDLLQIFNKSAGGAPRPSEIVLYVSNTPRKHLLIG
jgi:type VI secretion system protein ImpJ